MFVNEYIGGKLGLQEKNLSNSIYLHFVYKSHTPSRKGELYLKY